MLNYDGSPPKKKSRSDNEEYDNSSDSDDSFNYPVLDGPSQITQIPMQRTVVKPSVELQRQKPEEIFTRSSSCLRSPIGRCNGPAVSTWKTFPRQACSVTPTRFSLQERNDYHQNGQLLMLRNRIENMEREKERLAAATRDQIISKEKQHAAELLKKDERISQLETQIQCLRRENLQTSFQLDNVCFLKTMDNEMTNKGRSAAPLPSKKVIISRNDSLWKTAVKFGVGSSVLSTNSLSDKFECETRVETFTHIPSQQAIMEEPDPNIAMCNHKATESLPWKDTYVHNENKECQAYAIDKEWDVRRWMSESSLESFLSISLLLQVNNVDLAALSKLCQAKDFSSLKSCLR